MSEVLKARILFVITEKEETKKLLRLLKKYKLNNLVNISAKGTATSSILYYFGLDNTKRDVLMAIIPEFLEIDILYDICTKFKMNEPGKGLAFTINITSGNKDLFDEEIRKISKEEFYMKKDKKYELIISIVGEGSGTLCMEAAKKVGAGGGTLINGIGLGSKDAMKLLGITIEPEKDIVLILTEKTNKKMIMEEISEVIGLNENGRGICFSLPVESTIGLTEKIEFVPVEKE